MPQTMTKLFCRQFDIVSSLLVLSGWLRWEGLLWLTVRGRGADWWSKFGENIATFNYAATLLKSFFFQLIRNFKGSGGGCLGARALHHSHLLHHSDFQARVIVLINVKDFHVDKTCRCAANIRHIWVFELMSCQGLEECMIVGYIVFVRTRSITEASVEVSRLNYVIVAAELLEINFPFVSAALLIAVLSTKSLLLCIIFGFVHLAMLAMTRFTLCSHHRSHDVQGWIIPRFAALTVFLVIHDSQSILRAWLAVNVDAQRRLMLLQPLVYCRRQI